MFYCRQFRSLQTNLRSTRTSGQKLRLWSSCLSKRVFSSQTFDSLHIYNTLTSSKQSFQVDGREEALRFYVCGPTVYDVAHLGHARTYILFDTIRRILSNHFGFSVIYMMNITDIDDKIVNRAKERGTDISELTKFYTLDFLKDMQLIGVQPPTVMPKVTENMEQIVAFIGELVDNNYAYVTADGSVYFDVDYYNTQTAGAYGIYQSLPLDPPEQQAIRRKKPYDFALWKASKDESEPSFHSPWCKGRPGWHVECSAMINSLCDSYNNTIHLHAGGCDLRFPHHENEIAQSVAYNRIKYNSNKFCEFFIHSGHLHVTGKKMSKSLKNFITIKDILVDPNSTEMKFEGYSKLSSRQLRLLFLNAKYNSDMEFKPEILDEVIAVDIKITECYRSLNYILADEEHRLSASVWSEAEQDFKSKLHLINKDIHSYFCNDFDIPSVLMAIRQVCHMANVYLARSQVNYSLVNDVYQWLNRQLDMLGFGPSGVTGWDDQVTDAKQSGSSEQILQALVDFRLAAKNAALEKEFGKILSHCDRLRDEVLPALGIKLVDKDKHTSVTHRISPQERVEMQQKKDTTAAKSTQPPAQQQQPIDLENYFKVGKYKDVYSNFDGQHIPTHTKDGTPLSTKRHKKLSEKMERLKKKHDIKF